MGDGSKIRIQVTDVEDGQRLDRFLTDKLQKIVEFPVSRSMIQAYIPIRVYKQHDHSISGVKILSEGEVDNYHVVDKPSYKVKKGESFYIEIVKLQEISRRKRMRCGALSWPVKAESSVLSIVYEDDDVLVLNKPSGLVVYPSIKHPDGTLANYVKGYLIKKLGQGQLDVNLQKAGLVHRLDKDVSGLILFAKNSEAQKYLQRQFKQHTIEKYYYASVSDLSALVSKRFKHNKWHKIEGCIIRDPANRILRKLVFGMRKGCQNGKYAVTYLYWLENNKCLIRIETGRTHQIRATFKALGYGIIGDELYGSNVLQSADYGRLELYAIKLKFSLPSGTAKTLEIIDTIGDTKVVQMVHRLLD